MCHIYVPNMDIILIIKSSLASPNNTLSVFLASNFHLYVPPKHNP